MTHEFRSKLFKLMACAFWCGAVVSSATPADAYAITGQSGGYANCSADSDVHLMYWCESSFDSTSYVQTIKFVTTVCNAGGCNSGSSTVYTDFEYPYGRKPAYEQSHCATSYNGMNVYGLGSCAC
jgi:hypothetical protein